jgi:hypothetical protein
MIKEFKVMLDDETYIAASILLRDKSIDKLINDLLDEWFDENFFELADDQKDELLDKIPPEYLGDDDNEED